MVSGESQPEATVIRLPDRERVPVPIGELEAVGPRAVRTGSHVVVAHDPALRPEDGLTVSTWIWLAPDAPRGRRRALLADLGRDRRRLGARPRCRRPAVLRGRRRRSPRSGRRLAAGRTRRLGAARGRARPGRRDDRADPPAPAGAAPGDRRRLAGQRAGGRAGAGARAAAAGRRAGAGRRRRGASRRQARRARDRVRGRRRDPRRRVAARRGTGAARPRRRPARPARVVRERPAARGHRARLARRRARLAPGAGSVRGDALPLRRRRRPRLGAELRARAARTRCREACTGCGSRPTASRTWSRSRSAARRRRSPAPNVLVLPTFTYLAYSCEREGPEAAGVGAPRGPLGRRGWAPLALRPPRGRRRRLRGVAAAAAHPAAAGLPLLAARRPARPRPGPDPASRWLRRHGIGFDVVTDHDLHHEGADALAGNRTVITGAHPEYASAALLDALDSHLEGGGSLAYLGGNGLNGSVSVDPARPHVIELRRCETQGLMWQAPPGEHHHASGEYGGDWRRRGRPEHRTLGVGLRAFGDAPAVAYARLQSGDPAAAIAFAGLEPGAEIDADGAVLGGPAGYEVDGFDPRLGSPADAVVLATAAMPAGYEPWPDDVVDGPGGGGGAARRHGRLPAAGGRRRVLGRLDRLDRLSRRRRRQPRLAGHRERARRARARGAVPGAARWLSRRRGSAGGASTSRWSEPATTGWSPRPTWPGPACARSVVERREIVGGACTTEEFAPGFHASPGAYVLSLLRPAVWRDFALRARGLEVLEAAPTLNVFRDGARLTLHDDDRETARELARFDRADAAAYPRFRAELVEIADLLGPWFDRPPPGAPGWLGRDSVRAIGGSLGAARRHGLAAAKLFATSARDHLEQRFRSEHVGAALGWDAISNTLAGPSTPGTAYSLLHEHAAASLGGSSWGFVRGGMGIVTALLADAAAEAGAVIVTGAPVERILVDGGRAQGLQLADGTELAATTVVSNADPKRTLLELVGRDAARPRDRRGDRGLQMRRGEPEDQPGARRTAANRGHAGRPAAVPPRFGAAHPPARRHGRRPGGRPPRDPGPGPARRALRPERARPVARAARAPRRHARLSLAALPARRVGLGSRARAGRRPAARRRRDDDPQPAGSRDRAPGAHAARPRAHAGADRRPSPPRRHVPGPARPAAPGDRARRLPDANRRPLPVRRRAPTRAAASPAPTVATAPAGCSRTCAAGVAYSASPAASRASWRFMNSTTRVGLASRP